MSIVCFRHPKYDGQSSPVLSCKTCCGLFLAALKQEHIKRNGSQDIETWLKEKVKLAQERTRVL